MVNKFSLINVTQDNFGYVSGYWIQDHIGTLESANALKIATNAVNSNKLDIAIIEQVNSVTPMLGFFTGKKRLDDGRDKK
jgi:hypothetical protein